jgi:hypothetical protein
MLGELLEDVVERLGAGGCGHAGGSFVRESGADKNPEYRAGR